MKDSYSIVADAVREYWKSHHFAEPVIAFFYQKYEYESDTEWEWCEELIENSATDDFETVIFQFDFCEGQTCVKELVVVPFDKVTEYYTKNVIKGNAEV